VEHTTAFIMNLAVLSLLALILAILVSCFTSINVGFLSIALAFLIGHFAAGLAVPEILSGFPSSLFLTLAGVTLLFSQASVNGTLEKSARRLVRLARGNRGVIPIVFFLLALVLGASGAGGIAAAALLAPVAMRVAGEAGIGGFLMTIMLANGSNAGTFSPIAPTGIIANNLMAAAGLEGMAWPNFFNTLAAQSFVAFGGYFLLGGARLFRGRAAGVQTDPLASIAQAPNVPFDRHQVVTLAVIGGLIVAVVVFGADVGLGAFVAAVVLSLAGAANEHDAVRAMPWGVILMVCGVAVLIGVMDKTGGMDLFTGLLARAAGPSYITGVMAFVTGVISVYSSSSGVVLPAFLPTIPGLVENLPGANPLMIAYSVNVGAHLVDVSPLSTIGALCLAGADPREDRQKLFAKLMAWGWSMAVVGAVVCQLFFGTR
jgi:Na+/H+ antiporter NhaD/arsenite permease-like protein